MSLPKNVPAAREKFADRLRSLRKGAHYTQQEISDLLEIKRSTYAYYETKTCEPDITMFIKMASLFHVTIDYLLGYDDRIEDMINIAQNAVQVNDTEKHVLSIVNALPPAERDAWIGEGDRRIQEMIEPFPHETEVWQNADKN